MHLLVTRPGQISDGSEPVDIDQSPGDIVFLSTADTELACLAAAVDRGTAGALDVRMLNLLALGHNYSTDLYVDRVVSHARLVVIRLLGGRSYWPYGVERIAEVCRKNGIGLACLAGEEAPDTDLLAHSTLSPAICQRLWAYGQAGGVENAGRFLMLCRSLLDLPSGTPQHRALDLASPPEAVPEAGELDGLPQPEAATASVALILFYRANMLSGDVAPVQALAAALAVRGLRPRAIYVSSLKNPEAARMVLALLGRDRPAVILNTTAFAVRGFGGLAEGHPLEGTDYPVLQVVPARSTEEDWAADRQGLGPRDIAMHVAIPETDGRLLTRAVSFKTADDFHEATQCAVARYVPRPDRVAFVADLATRWARLRKTPAQHRRVALIVANYPNRDGRLANGVGLDTPAGLAVVLGALDRAGYDIGAAPCDGAGLMANLRGGLTNALAGLEARTVTQTFPVSRYRTWFATQPEAVQQAVTERWGDPDTDPYVQDGGFRLPAHMWGNMVVAVQPARGYNVDPQATYHDPDLVPPHAYLAFYQWLRDEAGADVHAVVHMGKHGNLEWLPGKALALSGDCFPEVALGPMPHVYPFIVNDPGEGSQAKRRSAAVIIDHLTPPLTRAETYGPLRDLEQLVDEYFEAASLHPARASVLKEQIIDLSWSSGLAQDLGMEAGAADEAVLGQLDAHLCDLKELQIRDGLHVFGVSPTDRLRRDLLCALVRLPRGDGTGGGASLLRALAGDLALSAGGFDPLDCAMAEAWTGPRPEALKDMTEDIWRTCGDTVERLELLAADLIAGDFPCPENWPATATVLEYVRTDLGPVVDACGPAEVTGILTALDGRFVAPGPSGAPTRGRPEVLPTGRNFYSVDTRAVPTPAAWSLGWKSASLLCDRHMQDHGEELQQAVLNVWGTANMRTGGEDIAQALALLGVRPQWEPSTGRVSGFEVLPATVLGRSRVDVTLRISGFFRDAFPALIALFDSAVQAVAALGEEGANLNPLAARVAADMADGGTARRATQRIFGSKPGAYGAGLQAIMSDGGWAAEDDLAAAYLAWSGYGYGAGADGEKDGAAFEARLKGAQAIVHNQDNREHDLLDSDDYYQFEGGLSVAVKALTGARIPVYHNDHSRPESPKIRTLEEEIARVMRGRVVNPKWIAGVMRHDYKGAFEIAATVEYMCHFAATTGAVKSHQFDAVFDAFLEDETVRTFMERANPDALVETAHALHEMIDRGYWQPRRNSVPTTLDALRQHLSNRGDRR